MLISDQSKLKLRADIAPIAPVDSNLAGPVLGGFLADPVTLYPSLFPQNSIWTSYPYLLPNLAVAFFQAASWITAFFLLPETHPELSIHPSRSLGIWRLIRSYVARWSPMPPAEGNYEPVNNDQSEFQAGGRMRDAPSIHELEDISVDKESEDHPNPSSGNGRVVAFTAQVVFQIISVSLLAFHKVSSDAVMPTFLATPVASSGPESPPRQDLLQSSGGFGYSNYEIGLVLLSQAIVAVVTQATLVPLFINRMGPLWAYRAILCVYPAMYLFTPVLPKLAPWMSLTFVLFDLWIKVILSSIGYICSAML